MSSFLDDHAVFPLLQFVGDPQTFCEMGGGFLPTLANIIAVSSWVAPIFLLPGSLVLIFNENGAKGAAIGLLTGVVLAGGPKGVGFRAPVMAILAAVTMKAEGKEAFQLSALGTGSLFIMLAMITELPGR